ncbi:MAG: phosphodiester glycosidase family protein [Elusimicrobiota bacterium]
MAASRRVAVGVALFAFCSPWASAEDASSGLVYADKGGYHVIIADLASKALEVRVARPHSDPKLNKRTVAQHAAAEDALVAVNANYFGGSDNHPCGAARGYGIQYPGIYGEAKNCETSLGWGRGGGEVFHSGGRETDPKFKPELTEVVTGGGYLLRGGLRVEWNRGKFAQKRPCTAAGLSADRRKLVLVVGGNRVCTGEGLQKVLLGAGAADAVHLDGGGSAKMWIKDRGYVDSAGAGRAPPVAIVIKRTADTAKCPSDCGSAPCIQLPPPLGPQCLGMSCRRGLNNIWNCDPARRDRIRCEKGKVVRQPCAAGCLPQRPGRHDICAACPSGNGLYCGNNQVLGRPDMLYRCTGGVLSAAQRCAGGCLRMPPGTNDKCR